MSEWTCPECGESAMASEFARSCAKPWWTEQWPEGVARHWPSGLPASSFDALFAQKCNKRGQANALTRRAAEMADANDSPASPESPALAGGTSANDRTVTP